MKTLKFMSILGIILCFGGATHASIRYLNNSYILKTIEALGTYEDLATPKIKDMLSNSEYKEFIIHELEFRHELAGSLRSSAKEISMGAKKYAVVEFVFWCVAGLFFMTSLAISEKLIPRREKKN